MTESNRNMQMVRLQKIVDFLSNSRYGYTVEQILQKLLDHGLTCTKRTIYRDLQALMSTGYPLKEDEVAHKWRIEAETKVGHAFQITPQALIGLYILKGIASPLMESPFAKDLIEFFNTIDSKVGEKGREYLDELSQAVHFSNGSTWGAGVSSEILQTIRLACTERQVLEVGYESTQGGKRVRKLGPQNIYFAQGSFYLIAEDMEESKVKTFALPRFSSAEMLDEEYLGQTVPPSQMLSNSFAVYMANEAEKVELIFDKDLALYIKERRWHDTQTLETRLDGRVCLKADLAITPDFIGWVMSFGDKVEVASPNILKDEIKRIVSNMLNRYAETKAS
ncbi:MAG: WYL domain-containing transcriptional regulator [Proteobacteria bacterium]|nr:MAG: WYL domain-containing transcriptional regulator [Pseudomonadota bacterium]